MKKTLLVLTAILTFGFLSAQTIGDLFTVGDYNYKVTMVTPNFEAEVASVDNVTAWDIPVTAIDASNSTVYNVTAIGSLAYNDAVSALKLASVALPTFGFFLNTSKV